MNKAKKSVFVFVAALTMAFIMGATMNGPELGMNNAQSSEISPADAMKIAGRHEGGGHCC